MARPLALALLCALLPVAALAHSVEGVAGGFQSGVLHPLLGPDHLVAMVAVGLWGAQLGMPLLVALPIAFPMMMAVGGTLGVLGVPVPQVALGVALSAFLLGFAVAAAFRAPVWLAVLIVGLFAIFHGHAHGTEIPEASSPIAYGAGFMLATGLLHGAGIAIGLLNDWEGTGPWIVRGCGAAIALLGLWFTAGVLGVL
ncbi:MAG: HupE/UreJ family protein [Paracoccaceae bacterium]